jgi:hypothetical protein
MKMNRILRISLVITFAIFMGTGCKSGQSEPAEQAMQPSATAPLEQDTSPAPKPQAAVETKQVDEKNAPSIHVTKDVHDFGQIGPNSSHQAHYEFENKGPKTLLVKNIQSTCGCSKPTLIKDGKKYAMPMKEPVAFEPGESGQVEVTFKAPTTKGNVSKHLYIVSDDPETQRAQLEVKAQIMVKVEVSPERVDLKFDQENAGMPDLVVKSIDGQAFSIKSINVVNNVVNIPFDAKEQATEFVLKPEVDIQKLNQFTTGVIRITTTHPQAGQLVVRYTAKPMYEVTNPRYILQNVEPGTAIIRENLIRSNYGKPAEIESVTSRNGYMEIAEQQADGDHIKLSIKITPPSQDASTRRYITDELKITLKGGYNLSIRCSGWFRLK